MRIETISIDVEESDDVILTWRDDRSMQITVTQAYGKRLDLWLPPSQVDDIARQLSLHGSVTA